MNMLHEHAAFYCSYLLIIVKIFYSSIYCIYQWYYIWDSDIIIRCELASNLISSLIYFDKDWSFYLAHTKVMIFV